MALTYCPDCRRKVEVPYEGCSYVLVDSELCHIRYCDRCLDADRATITPMHVGVSRAEKGR
jgi:hypothetical protein